MGLILKNGKSYGGTLPSTAKHLKYDNTNSDISSENVQGAIDELANKTIEGTVSSAQKDGDGNIITETYLTKTGDSANNITSFTSADSSNPTSYADIDVLGNGEKHSSIFNKLSVVFKNVRYIWKLLGNTDISAIGNGTVTGGRFALGLMHIYI